MSSSVAFELVPGRVLARVFVHELVARGGPVPCFSYVTEGLRASHQKELVFTLVRDARAGLEHAPREPLAFLRAVADLAAQGRLVGAGAFTELGATGLLGRPSIRGVAYQTAWPMEGVALPDGCLAAIALVDHEMETVKRYGTLRVLARLGRLHGFFPTAPWCDPDRAPAMPPESQTILEGVASGFFEGVSAVMDGDRVAVRIDQGAYPAIARSLPGLPLQAALAFQTVLDPAADACLVWSSGQQGPEAIMPPGSRAARPSGCFMLMVPQQAYDGGNPFEDGFAMMLTDASWARVRQALLSGAPVTISASQPGVKSLAIEWTTPAPARPVEVPAVSEMRMTLREPQADIDARVGMQALVAYADAIEKTVQQHFVGPPGPGAVLELDVVLRAGAPPSMRVVSYPDLAAVPSLHARLAALAPPPIRAGEIAFRGAFALWGGAPATA